MPINKDYNIGKIIDAQKTFDIANTNQFITKILFTNLLHFEISFLVQVKGELVE